MPNQQSQEYPTYLPGYQYPQPPQPSHSASLYQSPASYDPNKIITNPLYSVLWGIAWAIVSAIGFIVLISEFNNIVNQNVSGVRVRGFLMIMPMLATGLTIGSFIASITRAVKWSNAKALLGTAHNIKLHNQRIYTQQSGYGFLMTVSLVSGAITVIGLALVVIFGSQFTGGTIGVIVAIEMLTLVCMLSIGSLSAAVRRRPSIRHL